MFYEIPTITCSFCHEDDIREDHHEGIMKCVSCGLVVDAIIYTGIEFTKEHVPKTQAGQVRALTVSNNGKSGSSQIAQIYDSYDSSLATATKQAKFLCQIMNLKPQVSEVAVDQLHVLRDSMKKFTGFNMEHIGTAVVIVAVNILCLPISMRKIIKVSEYNEEKILSVYAAIKGYCQLPDTTAIIFEERQETQLLKKHCSKLSISRETTEKAEKILGRIIDGYWLNGHADTKIAVAIWTALQQETTSSNISLKDVSIVVGPAVNTIRNNYRTVSSKLIFE
jgi:transcription initiation factor TFIIIB Brf1 subunit/transcription initiation factor TFIIB